jgi:hypothetical protein
MDENAQSDQSLVTPLASPSVEVARVVHGLSDAKLQAVVMLVAGDRPGVVAKRLGVSRETLWRWTQDPAFRQHKQRLRVALHVSRIDRTWALVDKSLDVIEQHLSEGDLQAATTLLRLAQLNPSVALPDGPEDASPLADQGD